MSRRPATVVAILISAAVLSGCGTGLQAQNYKPYTPVEGVNVNVGGSTGMAIRNLHVEAPAEGSEFEAGATAYVTGGLINAADRDDALVGAFSAASQGGGILLDGKPVEELPIRAGAAAPFTWALQLEGLTKALSGAEYIDVTLVFRNAGRVTVTIPVFVGDTGLDTREELQNPYGEH